MYDHRNPECWKMFLLGILILALGVPPVLCTIEEVEVTPTNTNGVELGELSFMQFILLLLIFLKFVAMYTVGVLPLEINLGAFFEGNPGPTSKRGFIDKEAEISTFLLDCPLQFVCDVDAWANKDHEYFTERLLASWFRNPNQTWHHEDSGIFGGGGTCKEMYPCPFDVQEAVGIRIPGSSFNHITSDGDNGDSNIKEESYSFF